MNVATFLQIDAAALAGASLAALACALVGNFLVVTRQAMLADALTHVMLPGVLAAFLITGGVAAPAMVGGGIAAALAAAGLITGLTRFAGVDPSASIGIVFTTLFAAGIVALERTGASAAGFDVHHVLYGNLEGLVWPTATGLADLLDPARLEELPPRLGRMAICLLLVAIFVALFRRPLALVAFDPDFATAIGLPTRAVSLLLLVLTALASVAAFDAVGAILALAMIVCPPATARLVTDRFGAQIALSLALALGSVWAGYGLAVLGPPALGAELALNAAGAIGTVSGLVFGATALALRWRERGRRLRPDVRGRPIPP